ncbi:hypothetical protein K491DRAFT_449808 [Lophiostoma macrostomum CBS 122681]|uniref:RING-type domain-containing protein n=1 Tax=Lophiostoma macrostomum CBS 122681 TaxID=1314788 RepID=A0A6A6TQ80_9PLEO|nr:hypothetical protein K491DRAFT_449808 [Lophiostoma macrostomum CBS 122681]
MILDVLPEIAINHVLELINEQKVYTTAACERLITRLLDEGSYPKERDELHRKRKRGRSSDSHDEVNNVDSTNVPGYFQDALNLLKEEFLNLSARQVKDTLNEHKTLAAAYAQLDMFLENYDKNPKRKYEKLQGPRAKRWIEAELAAKGSNLPKELERARRTRQQVADQRFTEAEAKRAEEANYRRAQITGELQECQCCFDEFPLNRMVTCSGETLHFICRDCTKNYVEVEIGSGRCQPACFADTACRGTFTRRQLQECLDNKTFERLEHMQQQDELRKAGLDFLEECPFCDYKADYPPVEVNKEFNCLSPKCGKTSCRLCHKETHIPRSCEEVKKDEGISVRHRLEEAKSEALIRKCNSCKNPFIKEHGCNKMTCTKCGNTQCYCCSSNVTNYNHFGNGKCPLHDNQEARHEQDVDKAEAEALAKIRAEHPEIAEDDLKIKMSDSVKRAEEVRRRQAQQFDVEFPYHMDGEQLRPGRPLGPLAGVNLAGGLGGAVQFGHYPIPHHPMPHIQPAPAPVNHPAPQRLFGVLPRAAPQPRAVPQAGYQNQNPGANEQLHGWGVPWPFDGLFGMPGHAPDPPQFPDPPARPARNR